MKKILLTLAIVIGMFLPLEVFIILWISLGPASFWQKFAMVGAGLYLGFALQIVFCLVGLVLLAGIWELAGDKERRTVNPS
jgi:hypothetical protein